MTLGERCDEIVRLIEETLSNVAADDLTSCDAINGSPFEGEHSEVHSSGLFRLLNSRLHDDGGIDRHAQLAG